MIKAVIFDMDNTLMDRHEGLKLFAADQYRRRFAGLAQVTEAAYMERFVVLDNNGRLWKDIVYQQLVAEFNLPSVSWETLLDEYVSLFRNFCHPLPGLHKMIATFQQQNIKLAVITNGPYPFQRHNFEAMGITDAFEFVMVSEQEGLRKPDPAIFQRALNRLGLQPHEAVYVGDNPIADVQGAHSASMKAVFRPSVHWDACPTADATCENLADLPQIIQSLND
ncbi:MAG: HAD-IA family hydrolase [Chloroflexota bacterium]